VSGYKNMWYSFDYGMVHVVVINTETDFPNAPSGPNTTLKGGNFQGLTQQRSWFEADLLAANANRAEVPGNCDSCRFALKPLILQYNVDFYFCGHVHWYERLYPTDTNGNPLATNYNNQSGLIHITNGAGGTTEGKTSISSVINASAVIVSAYRIELRLVSLNYFNSIFLMISQ
jgi:hypothetical protein